jgi:hypothetical protein
VKTSVHVIQAELRNCIFCTLFHYFFSGQVKLLERNRNKKPVAARKQPLSKEEIARQEAEAEEVWFQEVCVENVGLAFAHVFCPVCV